MKLLVTKDQISSLEIMATLLTKAFTPMQIVCNMILISTCCSNDCIALPIHGRTFMRNVTRVLLPILDQRSAMIAHHIDHDLQPSDPVDPISSRIPSNPTFEVWSSNDKIYATDDDNADAIAGDVGIFATGAFSIK